MLCSIGEFYMVHYQPMLNKYSYHIILLRLLRKHKEKIRKEKLFLNDNNYVTTERDYAGALKV